MILSAVQAGKVPEVVDLWRGGPAQGNQGTDNCVADGAQGLAVTLILLALGHKPSGVHQHGVSLEKSPCVRIRRLGYVGVGSRVILMGKPHAEGVRYLPPCLLLSHFCDRLVHLDVPTQQVHTRFLLSFHYCRIGSRELDSRKVH
jgi:hypothetical protein